MVSREVLWPTKWGGILRKAIKIFGKSLFKTCFWHLTSLVSHVLNQVNQFQNSKPMNNCGNAMKKQRWYCFVEENALFFMWNLVTSESKNKITHLLMFPDTSLFPMFICLSSHLSIMTTSLIKLNSIPFIHKC